jgi:hypothetical protein
MTENLGFRRTSWHERGLDAALDPYRSHRSGGGWLVEGNLVDYRGLITVLSRQCGHASFRPFSRLEP